MLHLIVCAYILTKYVKCSRYINYWRISEPNGNQISRKIITLSIRVNGHKSDIIIVWNLTGSESFVMDPLKSPPILLLVSLSLIH